MRSLIEVVLLGAVVALAWDKSFSERVGDALPASRSSLAAKYSLPSVLPHAQQVSATASTARSGAWMWDPNRRTALDRPAYNDSRTYYVDEYGRRYWFDARGQRQQDE